jgi:protein-S-isoprenylcysteine O-methyltransferase Ste14
LTLGPPILLGNAGATVIRLIPMALAYAYRIRVEERVLSKDLGETYRAYSRRTGA